MTAPSKPWERSLGEPRNEMSGSLSDLGMSDTVRGATALGNPRLPPPVPSRPSQLGSTLGSNYGYGGYGSYSGLGGMGYGGGLGYGGLGMYGGSMYGGYGSYGRYSGMPGDPYNQNSFVRRAEESSRQAFQSIESIVQAFGSVAMMLESTFSAMYNSFRAVIGVADNFTRMKIQFAQIFSAFAVIRTVRWIFNKLLVLLRLKEAGVDEELWNAAAREGLSSIEGGGPPGGRKANWPILLFFAVIIGGPWLIWRLLSSLSGAQDVDDWATGEGDHFAAVAEYDFQGDGSEELSFHRGQKVVIAPTEMQPRGVKGWLLASTDGGNKKGLVPANYVKVLGKRKGSKTVLKASQSHQNRLPSHMPPPASNSQQNLAQSWPQDIPGCNVGAASSPELRSMDQCFEESSHAAARKTVPGTDTESAKVPPSQNSTGGKEISFSLGDDNSSSIN